MAKDGQVVSEEVEQLLLCEIIKHMAPMNVVAIRTEEYIAHEEDSPSLWVYAKFLGEAEDAEREGEKLFQLMDVLSSKLEECGETRYPVIMFESIEETEAKVDRPAFPRDTESTKTNEGQVVSERVERLLVCEIVKHMTPMNLLGIRTEQWGEGSETGPSLWVYARYIGEEVEWGGEKFFQLMDELPSKLEEHGETRRPVVLFERIEGVNDVVA